MKHGLKGKKTRSHTQIEAKLAQIKKRGEDEGLIIEEAAGEINALEWVLGKRNDL